jgi:iron-sulfur cluster assembly protein
MIIPVSQKQIPVTLTSRAVVEVKTIMAQKNISTEDYGLRVGIKGGGCSGASFLLGFDKAKSGDEAYFLDSFYVFIEKKHVMYILGIEIDFETGENGTGFVFNNPTASN